MKDRKVAVMNNMLDDRPVTLTEATSGLSINYHQRVALLRDMEEDGTIQRVGKSGAKILYRRSVPTEVIETTARHLGQTLTVTGAHMDGFDLVWELKAPNGTTLSARLLDVA